MIRRATHLPKPLNTVRVVEWLMRTGKNLRAPFQLNLGPKISVKPYTGKLHGNECDAKDRLLDTVHRFNQGEENGAELVKLCESIRTGHLELDQAVFEAKVGETLMAESRLSRIE